MLIEVKLSLTFIDRSEADRVQHSSLSIRQTKFLRSSSRNIYVIS